MEASSVYGRLSFVPSSYTKRNNERSYDVKLRTAGRGDFAELCAIHSVRYIPVRRLRGISRQLRNHAPLYRRMERHPLLNAQLCHCTGAALFWVDAARFRPARAANLSPRRTLDGLPDDACWPAAHPAERFRSAADACPGNSPAFRYRRRFIRNHHELYQPPPLPTSGAHFIRLCRFGHRASASASFLR